MDIKEEIITWKKRRNAVILAHVYQSGDVQSVADYYGDSLDLSRKAAATDAAVIVFCGVRFMAETAFILNPKRIVLLPDMQAGCELAEMVSVGEIGSMKRRYPAAAVVSYVNSSAEIKAVSDICCTSANAVKVVNSLDQEDVIFVPDRNLGSYVAERSKKRIILPKGYCYVHENITPNMIKELKERHPAAKIMVHPECIADVRQLADFIGSTAQMSHEVSRSSHQEFVIGTETDFVWRLRQDYPYKTFYPVCTFCNGMKRVTLENVRQSLEHMVSRIRLSDDILTGARKAVDRMLKT